MTQIWAAILNVAIRGYGGKSCGFKQKRLTRLRTEFAGYLQSNQSYGFFGMILRKPCVNNLKLREVDYTKTLENL